MKIFREDPPDEGEPLAPGDWIAIAFAMGVAFAMLGWPSW